MDTATVTSTPYFSTSGGQFSSSSSSSSPSVTDSLTPSLNVYSALLHVANIRQQESQTLHNQMQVFQQQQQPILPPPSSSSSSMFETTTTSIVNPTDEFTGSTSNNTTVPPSFSLVSPSPLQVLQHLSATTQPVNKEQTTYTSTTVLPLSSTKNIDNNNTMNNNPSQHSKVMVVHNPNFAAVASSASSSSSSSVTRETSSNRVNVYNSNTPSSSSMQQLPSISTFVLPPPQPSSVPTTITSTPPGLIVNTIVPSLPTSSSSSSAGITVIPKETSSSSPKVKFLMNHQPHHPYNPLPEQPQVPLLQGTFRENMVHRYEYTDGISRILNSYSAGNTTGSSSGSGSGDILLSTAPTNNNSVSAKINTSLLSPSLSSSSYVKRKIEPRHYNTNPNQGITTPSAAAGSTITSSIVANVVTDTKHNYHYNTNNNTSVLAVSSVSNTASTNNELHRPVQQHLLSSPLPVPTLLSPVPTTVSTSIYNLPIHRTSVSLSSLPATPVSSFSSSLSSSTLVAKPLPYSKNSSRRRRSSSSSSSSTTQQINRTPILPRTTILTGNSTAGIIRTPGVPLLISSNNANTNNDKESLLSSSHPILGSSSNGSSIATTNTKLNTTTTAASPYGYIRSSVKYTSGIHTESLSSSTKQPSSSSFSSSVPFITIPAVPVIHTPAEKPHRPHRSIVLQQQQQTDPIHTTTGSSGNDKPTDDNKSLLSVYEPIIIDNGNQYNSDNIENISSSSPSIPIGVIMMDTNKDTLILSSLPTSTNDDKVSTVRDTISLSPVPVSLSSSSSSASIPLLSSSTLHSKDVHPVTNYTDNDNDDNVTNDANWSQTASQIQMILTNKRLLSTGTPSSTKVPLSTIDGKIAPSTTITTSHVSSSSLSTPFSNSPWVQSVRKELSQFKNNQHSSSLDSEEEEYTGSTLSLSAISVTNKHENNSSNTATTLHYPTGNAMTTAITVESFQSPTVEWSNTTLAVRSPSKEASANGAQQGIDILQQQQRTLSPSNPTHISDTNAFSFSSSTTPPVIIPTVFTQFSTRTNSLRNNNNGSSSIITSPLSMLASNPTISNLTGVPLHLLPPPPPLPVVISHPMSTILQGTQSLGLPPPPPPPPMTDTLLMTPSSASDTVGLGLPPPTLPLPTTETKDLVLSTVQEIIVGTESTNEGIEKETTNDATTPKQDENEEDTKVITSALTTPILSSLSSSVVRLPSELASDIPSSPKLSNTDNMFNTPTETSVSVMAPTVFSYLNDLPPSPK